MEIDGEALDRSLWIIRFGRKYGPLVRQATGCMNELINLLIDILR